MVSAILSLFLSSSGGLKFFPFRQLPLVINLQTLYTWLTKSLLKNIDNTIHLLVVVLQSYDVLVHLVELNNPMLMEVLLHYYLQPSIHLLQVSALNIYEFLDLFSESHIFFIFGVS